MGMWSNYMVRAKIDFGTEISVTLVYRKFVACDELYC